MLNKFILATSFLIQLTAIHNKCYSWDCKTPAREKEFNQCEFVFIGEISRVDSLHVAFKPYEMLKGEIKETFWAINYYTTGVPNSGYDFFSVSNEGEIWLVFGEKVSGDTVIINPCGWSTNIFDPFVMEPPPPNMDQSESVDYTVVKMAKLTAGMNLFQYIQAMRYRKEQSEVAVSNSSNEFLFILIGLGLNSFLILVIFIFIFKIYKRLK